MASTGHSILRSASFNSGHVGHVPKKISSVCSTFDVACTIHCRVIASGRYIATSILKKFASLIFAVRDQSAKTAKIMRLENLALYGIL